MLIVQILHFLAFCSLFGSCVFTLYLKKIIIIKNINYGLVGIGQVAKREVGGCGLGIMICDRDGYFGVPIGGPGLDIKATKNF
jgi:hypothetical protein